MFGFHSHNWNIKKGANVGKANGLSIWLDAETFDYTFHADEAGEGFKLAIMHHLDQPIMSIRELVFLPKLIINKLVAGHRNLESKD